MEWVKNPELNQEVGTPVGHDAQGAAVVVMEVKTGDILAMASYPTFDLSTFNDDYEKLTADPLKPMNPVSKHSLELSDVISYHSYAPIEKMIPQIEAIKKYNRPILMTEWLNRINHSDVREIYPLLYLENIGNYCWGFVVGKTQTHEPWEGLWAQYYENPNGVNYDFTKWQHDLFRPNLRPYDPKEIELIQEYNKRADMRWNSGKE